jgi:hypothetical protein
MAPYDRRLELDAAVYRRANGVLARALRGGRQLTRQELSRCLAGAGIPAQGQRLAQLLANAEVSAVICSGPLRGRQFTYALLDERVPAAPRLSREESLAELARRYFSSHGPATARDFGNWSGLTMGEAKRAIASVDLRCENVEGKTWWLDPASAAPRGRPPRVLLLPNYDEYFIGYRDREPPHAGLAAATIRQDLLFAAHIVVLDGRPAGGWRRTLRKGVVDIEAKLALPFDAAARDALESAARRYARFLGEGTRATLRAVRV